MIQYDRIINQFIGVIDNFTHTSVSTSIYFCPCGVYCSPPGFCSRNVNDVESCRMVSDFILFFNAAVRCITGAASQTNLFKTGIISIKERWNHSSLTEKWGTGIGIATKGRWVLCHPEGYYSNKDHLEGQEGPRTLQKNTKYNARPLLLHLFKVKVFYQLHTIFISVAQTYASVYNVIHPCCT